MLIANPIYDTAFKRLMENNAIAKFFISTLLEQEVLSLEMRPQEYSHLTPVPPERLAAKPDPEYAGIMLFRVDFIAIVKNADGEQRKILVEVQKAWEARDIMRFRKYLAKQYDNPDIVDGETKTLPITTIYILDFILPEIPSPCVKVARSYIDLADNHKTLECKPSPFVECLTHDSFVVQAKRITNAKLHGRLAELLSVFEQNNFVGEKDEHVKEYLHTPAETAVRAIVDELHFVISNATERSVLENEREYLRTMNAVFGDQWAKIAEKDKEIAQKDETIAQKEEAIAQKDETIAQKDAEIARLQQLLSSANK